MNLVKVVRGTNYTEIHLQAQSSLERVCWHYSGPNSPYLVSGGNRYRLLSGNNITACPVRRDYAAGEVMGLRFAALGSGVAQFSLVEGAGGEAQMRNAGSSNSRFWNFLHIDAGGRCGEFVGPKPNGSMSYFDVTNTCGERRECWVQVNKKVPRYQLVLSAGATGRIDVGVLTERDAVEMDCTTAQ